MIDYDTLVPRKGPSIVTAIVDEDGLYLYDPGIWHRNAMYLTPPSITRKLVRCFTKAWMRIPEQDRNTLREFWKPRWPNESGTRPSPMITFDSAGHLSACQMAGCRGGHELLFAVRHVEYAKPTELVHIIAHELGHAISYPHGWYKHHWCMTQGGDECVACELQACSYMAAWGFDVRLALPLVFRRLRPT